MGAANAPMYALVLTTAAMFLVASPGSAREQTPLYVVPASERPQRIEQIHAAIDRYSAVTRFPLPQLESDRMDALLNGEVVRFREKWVLSHEGDKESERTRQRALAYRLIPSPRKLVWLATLDAHFPLNDNLTEFRMDHNGDRNTWYQFMDLPWPIRNRHWLIRVEKGVKVAEATNGQAWEHAWTLVKDGEATAHEWADAGRTAPLPIDKVKGARYLEANDGAWAMIALDENTTLLAYNLTIVLGGWVPEGMAARFATRALETLMDRVATNAERVSAHYVSGHEIILGGDAKPIEPFAGASASAQ